MNPSSSGWLNKMLLENHTFFDNAENESVIYYQLREVGFIYGYNLLPLSRSKNIHFSLSQSELAKVNLAQAMIKTHSKQSDQKVDLCYEPMLAFYELLKKENKFRFKIQLTRLNTAKKLEKILTNAFNPILIFCKSLLAE